eukprot:gene7902-biopygen6228
MVMLSTLRRVVKPMLAVRTYPWPAWPPAHPAGSQHSPARPACNPHCPAQPRPHSGRAFSQLPPSRTEPGIPPPAPAARLATSCPPPGARRLRFSWRPLPPLITPCAPSALARARSHPLAACVDPQ